VIVNFTFSNFFSLQSRFTWFYLAIYANLANYLAEGKLHGCQVITWQVAAKFTTKNRIICDKTRMCILASFSLILSFVANFHAFLRNAVAEKKTTAYER